MPVFGTCAGMILCATEVLDGRPDQHGFERIDVTVRRNGYGRQLDSFEADLAVAGLDDPFHAVFIRAPLVVRVGSGSRSSPSTTACLFCCVTEVVRGSVPSRADRRPSVARDVPRHARPARTNGVTTCPAIPNGQRSSTRRAPPTRRAASSSTSSPGRSRSPRRTAVTSTPTRRCAPRSRRPRPARMTNDAIDRAIKRGTGDADGGHVREHHVRGLRAGRGRPDDRRAHRQSQPHRIRDPQRVQQARRLDGRTGSGGLAVRSARRDPHRRGCRRGRR